MTRGPTNTWFDTLRRDRSLFVLLASFILLLQAMQPLAMASQATGGGHFVICTDGDVDPGQPQLHPDCAKCIAGSCRVVPVAAPDVAGANINFLAHPDTIAIRWIAPSQARVDFGGAAHLPPARGPPRLA